MPSYTTSEIKPVQILSNGLLQIKALVAHKKNILNSQDTSFVLNRSKWIEQSARELTHIQPTKIRLLEVGHGQMPLTLAYFASLDNEAYGIDIDTSINGLLDFSGYYQCFRKNGIMRTLKSLVKELTGINDVLRKEFLKQSGYSKWPALTLLQGDAKKIPLPNEYFDFIYSIDVFEHLDNPEAVINEIIRLLKPGGVVWLAFPNFGHPNALHDLRWITRSSDAPPAWSHLIPEQTHLVQQGAFINTLRLNDWLSLFERKCPGVAFDKQISNDSRIDGMIEKYRSLGQLQDYSDEELIIERLIVAWRKPTNSV